MRKLILLSICFTSIAAMATERVTIKSAKTLEVYQIAEFEDAQSKKDWLKVLEESSVFGKAAHEKIVEPERHDESGNRIPAKTEFVPSEYVVEVEDITAQVLQKKIDAQNRKLARADRLKKLKEIDWNKTTTVAHLKDIVKTLIEESTKEAE